MSLHETQAKLLTLLKNQMDDPMTIEQLKDALNLSSKSLVHHHITQLEKKGYLKRNPSNTKDYQLLGEPEKPIVYLNQYGMAECGPSGSILDGNPIDRIPIASRLLKFPSDEAFIVTAKGQSMTPDINPGDLVIAQKTNHAEDGDVVVCVNGGEALIKKLIKKANGIILQSKNPEFDPFLAEEDFRVEGIVRSVMKYS